MSNEHLRPSSRGASIDTAIDRAVREMVQIDPPAAFRRRVLSRLEAPPARPVMLARYGLIAASVALVALTVVLVRDRMPGMTRVETPSAVTAQRPLPADAAPETRPRAERAQPDVRTDRAPRKTGTHSEPIRMPPDANIFGARAPRIAAASDEMQDTLWNRPADAAVPREGAVGPPPIEMPEIVIAPLVIPPAGTPVDPRR